MSDDALLRLPADVVEGLDGVAAALDRSRSWVMGRALRSYLDAEGRDILEEASNLAALDRGEGVPLDSALAEMDAIIGAAEKKRATKR